MQGHAAVWIAIVFLLGAAEPDEQAKREIAKWQGTWKCTAMETDGKASSLEQLAKIKLTVTGTDYHFQNGSFSEHGSYQFDVAKEPKQLDIHVGDGSDKGKIYQVIYKVDGDQLTICLEVTNKRRPGEFTGKTGSGCVLEVWQRVKPAANQ